MAECERCVVLERQYRDVIIENTRNGEELAGLQNTVRSLGATNVALRRELAQAREDDPGANDIRAGLAYWQRKLHHERAKVDVKTPRGGKRWKVMAQALKDHTIAEVQEAIDGLALLPYVGVKGRKPTGKPSERFDDVEHALRDEVTVARFRSYAKRAKGASADTLFDAWQSICLVENEYAGLLLSELARVQPMEQAA